MEWLWQRWRCCNKQSIGSQCNARGIGHPKQPHRLSRLRELVRLLQGKHDSEEAIRNLFYQK